MKSHTSGQCSRRPQTPRPCLDSLHIQSPQPCDTTSKAGVCFPNPSFGIPCTVKYPECRCDQDFCTLDTCNSSTSCKLPSSPFCLGVREDNYNSDDLKMSKKQDGGCKNVEDYEFDVTFSCNSSATSQQRDVGETASINGEGTNRSCPMSCLPSVADQSVNTTANYTGQTPVAEIPSFLKGGCVKICRSRPTIAGGISRTMISKPSNSTKTSTILQNTSRDLNIGNSVTCNTQNNNILLEAEISYDGNEVSNLSRLSNSAGVPQDSRSPDFNKLPRYEENIDHESKNSPYESNSFCQPDSYQQKSQRTFSQQSSEEQHYFPKRQEFDDRQTSLIKSSRTNFNNQHMASDTRSRCNSDQDYHNSKMNLGSKAIEHNRNTPLLRTSTPLQPAAASVLSTDEYLQNTLNLNAPRYICDKCHNMFNPTSNEGMITPGAYIADDSEYQEPIHTGLASTSDSFRVWSKNLNIAEIPQTIKPRDLNSCCLRGTSEQTSSHISTPARRSAFMSPSLKSMLPKNDSVRVPTTQGSSDELFIGHGTCCEAMDSRPINKVNIPEHHNNIKVTSNRQVVSQKQSMHGNSKLHLQTYKEKSGISDNFQPKKGIRQVAGCCNHGISKLVTNVSQHHLTKNNPNIDCVCSDVINGDKCQKKVPCAQEVGASTCASTSCVINQTSGCRCRYPPAFKQFSCTGNINGSCNCSDDH